VNFGFRAEPGIKECNAGVCQRQGDKGSPSGRDGEARGGFFRLKSFTLVVHGLSTSRCGNREQRWILTFQADLSFKGFPDQKMDTCASNVFLILSNSISKEIKRSLKKNDSLGLVVSEATQLIDNQCLNLLKTLQRPFLSPTLPAPGK
jgi:hypothetical protein